MNDHPILMNGAMVRSTLAGIKTNTRRIAGGCAIKSTGVLIALTGPDTDKIEYDSESGEWYCDGGKWHKRCPYGKPGDRLWVRETWAHGIGQTGRSFDYKADCELPPVGDQKWKPSIHMPRAASRITLDVVSVRLEPLQAISEEGAEAEGALDWWNSLSLPEKVTHYNGNFGPIGAFNLLWDSINGMGAWDQNPYVWAVEFKLAESEVAK